MPLESASLRVILDQLLKTLEDHIEKRLDDRAFGLDVTEEARELLLRKGTSTEYGARELKRTILRMITQPMAAMVDREEVEPGSTVRVEVDADGERLNLIVEDD
jgi:ATP-dependent Clp protease ATP-binding subunit ClpC